MSAAMKIPSANDPKLEKDKLKDQKEDEIRRKKREKRLKEREKKEKKKIRSLVNFPFKILTELSILAGCIMFIVQFFGASATMVNAMFYAFLAFTGIYLGAGFLMVIIIYIISENKKKEIAEQKKNEEEQKRMVELKMEEELARLEELKKQSSSADNDKVGIGNNSSQGINFEDQIFNNLNLDNNSRP